MSTTIETMPGASTIAQTSSNILTAHSSLSVTLKQSTYLPT
jgi:hypothetical protein